MESVSLEMDDIFEDQFRGEDEDQLPEMLPDLPDGLESEIQPTQNDEEAENQEVLAKLKGMKGASKNAVKRHMPKLDGSRLTGERGIPILPHVFKDVKLKGKNHEVDDLRVVMRYLEHWAHRLFPMMPFDEVLERIERLGTKRDVQTCIKKMRMDMPVLGSDTVTQRGEDSDGSDQEQVGADQDTERQPSAEDMFDALLREERELLKVSGDKESNGGGTHAANSPSAASSSQPSLSQGTPTSQAGSSVLSAEVLERIERNRRLAMEKRAKKLGGPLPQGTSPVRTVSSSQPSSSQSEPPGSAVTLAAPQAGDGTAETSSSQTN